MNLTKEEREELDKKFKGFKEVFFADKQIITTQDQELAKNAFLNSLSDEWKAKLGYS